MNKHLSRLALVALGGSMSLAAGCATPSTTPASSSAVPAADTTTGDPPATKPGSAVPSNIELTALFAKMSVEGFTHNYNALAADVAQLQPVQDQLPPEKRAVLDGFITTLKAAHVPIPDVPAVAPQASAARPQPSAAA